MTSCKKKFSRSVNLFRQSREREPANQRRPLTNIDSSENSRSATPAQPSLLTEQEHFQPYCSVQVRYSVFRIWIASIPSYGSISTWRVPLDTLWLTSRIEAIVSYRASQWMHHHHHQHVTQRRLHVGLAGNEQCLPWRASQGMDHCWCQ